MRRDGRPIETVQARALAVKDRVVQTLYTLVTVGVLGGWAVFWSYIVSIHVEQGDVISAVVTALVLVVPAVAILGWYVYRGFEFDVSPEDVGGQATSG